MLLTPPRSLPHPPHPTAGNLLLAAFCALAVWLSSTGVARADVTTLDATAAPIVRINIRSGDVTIRTWDRRSVEVDGDPALSIERRTTLQPTEQRPVLIPRAQGPGRPGPVLLAPESFVVSSIPPGTRDAIVVKSTPETPAGPVVVTVPNDAVLVVALARGGDLDVRDYRGGTFVGITSRGRLALQNLGGTVFAQTGRGALVVRDSVTERLRARSLYGNITFERCRSRQIEATSVDGSIVYDDGFFESGLARFESLHGDVAIGTQNAAQLGARVAGDGRVYTNFERGARISGSRTEASVLVGGGGPVVTATTQSGNVYFFDGTLRTRDRLPSPWRQPISALQPILHRDAERRPAPHPHAYAKPHPLPRR